MNVILSRKAFPCFIQASRCCKGMYSWTYFSPFLQSLPSIKLSLSNYRNEWIWTISIGHGSLISVVGALAQQRKQKNEGTITTSCFRLNKEKRAGWWFDDFDLLPLRAYWPAVRAFIAKKLSQFSLAAMLRAFFIPLCSVQNTHLQKVFFRFFKEQILFFFGKIAEFWGEKFLKMQNFLMDIRMCW